MYSQQLLEHFENPRNVGEIENPDGMAKVMNPACGDIMSLHIKVEGDRICEAKFKTYGCPAAIASGSATTELLMGKTLEEALKVSRKDLEKALGGLEPATIHSSILAEDVIQAVVENYKNVKRKT
jgi:nitrogen fixation NifU-like protein